MKPFNLEEALAGKPIVTRYGEKARLICTDLDNPGYPLAVAIFKDHLGKEVVDTYTKGGNNLHSEVSRGDLFMASVKKEGWVNLYRIKVLNGALHPSRLFSSESEALDDAQPSCVATVKVEWEE